MNLRFKGEMQEAERAMRALSQELITLGLVRFRDLVVPLAERYPDSGGPLKKVVDQELRHFREELLILARHRSVLPAAPTPPPARPPGRCP
jgi:hypothetical protein